MSSTDSAVGLSPQEKRALLAELVRKKALRAKHYPASFAQERLWFLQQLAPDSSFYNLPFAIRLEGRLDVEALEHSFREINRRHAVLRTTFKTEEGGPVQVVHEAGEIPLSFADLGGLPEGGREEEARRAVVEETRRPFDLKGGPLWRAKLLRLGEEDHVLAVTMHHIISDGWSTGVLARELSALYEAYSAGRPSPLAELPIQYTDYAAWQRQRFGGGRLEEQLAYWRRQLGGAPELLELPTDRPRPAVQSFRGASRPFALSEALSESLRELSRRHGATLFTTLLAAFQALLSRYSGQSDICVGTPVAGRVRLETEGLVGFFVNTLVLRARVEDDPPFARLLARVRETVIEAQAYEELPFEKIVEALQPARDPSHSPLFQVAFAFSGGGPQPSLNLPGLTVSDFGTRTVTAKFDLSLIMAESGKTLAGSLEYNTDLFDADTAGRMLDHFQTLLGAAVAAPERRLSDLPLLTEEESRRMLSEWNRTGAARADGVCAHELFEAHARRAPRATAAVFDDERITYGELNARANQVAHRLKRLGVGPDVLVAIMAERSIEMLAGLLGVLKAGGAYVPLDPDYPRERLAFMLEDAAAPVLLTQQRLLDTLPRHDARVFCLDTQWDEFAAESEADPEEGSATQNLAYVIYTSGSTGRPKGVMLSHEGLCNLIEAQRVAFGVEEGERVLQFASLSFDASVSEIGMALCSGATLCLAPKESLMPVAPLLSVLKGQSITIATLPPSALAVLPADDLPGLKTVVSAGEAVSPEVVKRWAAGRSFVNAYGPTETTVCATAGLLDEGCETASIGTPIRNTQVYILDSHLHPLPVGVPGELHVGGTGLARGYLNRPGLTAGRFIPHPFSAEPGARLYKTGDLARYLPDGRIEFLGRMDHQVKLRGFRIELGEIESALKRHPSVGEAVVVARRDAGAESRLVAYVVARDGAADDEALAGGLRGHLREMLPEYMIPSAFVVLGALPLTPNGKVDRKALPAPGVARRALENPFVQPGNVVELKLVQIWEDLLGVSPVGVTDNFFALGGHSLLTVRLMVQIEKAFGRSFPLMTLFEHGTIQQLAQVLHEQAEAPAWSPLVPIQTHGQKRPFFCVHSVGGQVSSYYLLSRHLGLDRPFYGIQARLLFEAEVSERVTPIEETAARYLEAVREAQPEGPYLLGGYSFGGVVAYEMAAQLRRAGEQVGLVALFDTHSPTFLRQLPEDNDADLLVKLAWVTSRQHGKELLLPLEELQRLEPDEQLRYFMREMNRLDLLPAEAELLYLRRFLDGLAARRKALKLYDPKPADVRLTVFYCEQQDALMNRILEEAGLDSRDPALGWGELTPEPVDVRVVPGHHDRMMVEPYVRGVAQALRAAIEEAEAGPAGAARPA